MIFIRKSSATSNNVLDDDIQYSLNWDDPMPIFAITATNFTSAALAKCGDKAIMGAGRIKIITILLPSKCGDGISSNYILIRQKILRKQWTNWFRSWSKLKWK